MRSQGLTRLAIVGLALMAPMLATGCQTSVGGQTLPSAFYLEDDTQYYPAGAEFKLANQKERLDEYRLQREGFAADEAP